MPPQADGEATERVQLKVLTLRQRRTIREQEMPSCRREPRDYGVGQIISHFNEYFAFYVLGACFLPNIKSLYVNENSDQL